MIFVTVGTLRTYGFERLIKKMDEIAGTIDEKVIMQIGCTEYEPQNAQYFRFMLKEDMNKIYNDSNLIVCHSGIGSILTVLQFEKPFVLVPRMKKYNEHIDDHQLEISKELEKEMQLNVAYNIEDLCNVINNIHLNAYPKSRTTNMLIFKLKNYLYEIESGI